MTEAPSPTQLSAAGRRRALAGLTGTAGRLVLHLLAQFDGDWNAAKIETLRAYALSSARLEGRRRHARAES